jgi:hypothetical protein
MDSGEESTVQKADKCEFAGRGQSSGRGGGMESGPGNCKLRGLRAAAGCANPAAMNAWWEQLTPLLKIFWSIALFASVFQLIMFLGAIFGTGHDFDHDVAHDGASGAEGAQILSIRTLIAGAVGFGWAGVLSMGSGASDLAAIAIALVTGVVFMLLVFWMMRLLFSMRDDGTLNYQNAVGLTGRVYVTIPARRAGTGQIEIMFQGRLVTASAQTDIDRSLPPQASIRVTAAQSDNTLIVEPVAV